MEKKIFSPWKVSHVGHNKVHLAANIQLQLLKFAFFPALTAYCYVIKVVARGPKWYWNGSEYVWKQSRLYVVTLEWERWINVLLQVEGVGGRWHGNLCSTARLTFPLQWPHSTAGETRRDGDWSTTAARRSPAPTPNAGTMDRSFTVRLQQSHGAQLRRSVDALS